MARRPRRTRSRRAAGLVLLRPFRGATGPVRPELHDRPPPRWTGVPVERDPVTGRLLRGDPTGRSDKGRAGRSSRRAAIVAAAALLVLGAAALMVWLLGVGLGGEPDPAALDTAGPATTVPPATSAMTTSATVETSTATETTLAPALVPDPPSGLTATPVDPTTVQLTWTDLSTNETAFEIDDGQVTRTAPADAQELVWDGLAPGLQACFRVRAVGNAGASSWEPATDYVCVQTPQPDLIAQPIELVGGDAVCIGTSPVFQASGVNAGSAPSDDFVVRWLPDGGQPVDEPTSGLPPQGAEKYPFTWVRVQPGTHELVFALDADGRIVEADETNNQSVLTFEAVQCPG